MNMYNPPAPYMREIPEGSLISWNGSRYRMDSGSVVALCANHISDKGPEQLANTTTGDPFSPGAVAELPNGFRYIKTGDIWLLAPIPTPVPVTLMSRVPGFEDYWAIKQASYTGDSPIVHNDPEVISFNLRMSQAQEGDFPGAHENAFAHTTPEMDDHEVFISIEAPLMSPLESSFVVSATVTKGELIKEIAKEVERVFNAPNNVFLAFIDQALCKEANFKDLLLVDVVQRAEGVFQPTIAVRVPA